MDARTLRHPRRPVMPNGREIALWSVVVAMVLATAALWAWLFA